MWLPYMHSCGKKPYQNRNLPIFFYLLWFLTFSNSFLCSNGFFFPLFGNFFNKFRENLNNGNANNRMNGGVSLFSGNHGGSGNATLIKVPMLHSIRDRRVDVVTAVSNLAADDSHLTFQRNVNSTAAAEALLSSKLVVPTSTSMTQSISSSHLKAFSDQQESPSTLTLPFTPNLFGMMSYVQALKDIKRNYKVNEKERKIEFLNDKKAGDSDLMTRVLRTLIHKVVNKYQKQTEILKLKILKRQQKLQKFLQLPMVAHVITSDSENGRSGQPVTLGKDGHSVIITTNPSHQRSDKRKPSILDSFLI